jgi:hypothetical protein
MGGVRTVANGFSLTRKTEMEKGPVSLRQVEEEICIHFNIVPHPQDYYHLWFDTIGSDLASGNYFTDIIKGRRQGMVEYQENYIYFERKTLRHYYRRY